MRKAPEPKRMRIDALRGCTRFKNLLWLLYNRNSSKKQSPDQPRSYGPGKTILSLLYITAQNCNSKKRSARQDYQVYSPNLQSALIDDLQVPSIALRHNPNQAGSAVIVYDDEDQVAGGDETLKLHHHIH